MISRLERTETLKVALLSIIFVLGFALSAVALAAASQLAPNEMGQVMMLEYHQIGPNEGEWRRTPENFRRDLETLYAKGYRLINLSDYLDGRIKVEKGRTPVVMTFDDGAPKQFAQTAEGWDPDSAVGIILDFAKKHPDFGIGGTFYINLIGEKKLRTPNGTNILSDLVKAGFEIGNHTMTHPKLSKLSQSEVAREIAGLQKFVRRSVPGYKIRSIALPFGIYPKDDEWARVGEFEGESYSHDALFEVGSGPAASPFSAKLKIKHIPRIQARDSELEKFYKFFESNPSKRFVSDGNEVTVTVPASERKNLRPDLDTKLSVVEL